MRWIASWPIRFLMWLLSWLVRPRKGGPISDYKYPDA